MEIVPWKIFLLIKSSLEETYIRDEYVEKRNTTYLIYTYIHIIGIPIHNHLTLFIFWGGDVEQSIIIPSI